MKSIFTINDTNQEVIDLIKYITTTHGTERGVVCAIDCLYQWRSGFINETIKAWENWSNDKLNNEGLCEEERHGAWVPAIPL